MLLFLGLGAALGIGLYIFWQQPENRPTLTDVGTTIAEGAGQMKEALSQQVTNIDAEQIKDELARTGRVVRKKAEEAGVKIADAAADARLTAAIKSQYAVEPDLSALSISVNTTRGVVTLAGRASSHESIKKAMRLALATDGVTEVVSTLQVK